MLWPQVVTAARFVPWGVVNNINTMLWPQVVAAARFVPWGVVNSIYAMFWPQTYSLYVWQGGIGISTQLDG